MSEVVMPNIHPAIEAVSVLRYAVLLEYVAKLMPDTAMDAYIVMIVLLGAGLGNSVGLNGATGAVGARVVGSRVGGRVVGVRVGERVVGARVGGRVVGLGVVGAVGARVVGMRVGGRVVGERETGAAEGDAVIGGGSV